MAHHWHWLLPPPLVTGFRPTIPWCVAHVPECNPDHTPGVERERVQGLLEEAAGLLLEQEDCRRDHLAGLGCDGYQGLWGNAAPGCEARSGDPRAVRRGA